MTSITDMLNLNKLDMFQALRKILETNGANNVRNLLAYKDQILYVWNPDEYCLYSLLLSTVHEDHASYQKLYPGSPPLFDVNEILINEPGTLCALVGSKGVSVMRFPKRLGSKSLYDSSNNEVEGVTCRTSLLQDKFFISKHLTNIKRVRWYPGSPEDNHLVVLTNDRNCLRLFKVDNDTGKLVSIWQLGPQTSRILASLGDMAVDFDFAPPVLLGERTQTEPSIVWPILVLLGNGEVLCLNTTVDESMNIKSSKISGPLTMYPPADDNYSEDTCSIIVLDTVPPSVVIASNFGELYNCLLLPETQHKDDKYQYNNDNTKQNEYSLHIIETIELELGLNILDNRDYDSSNIIQLKKDAALSSRYWCLHNTGVHSVTIPITDLLDEFSKSVNDNCYESPIVQGQSLVEYYICTGLMNGETKPIKGCTVINFPMDLLVTLLSSGEIVTQTIPDYFHNKLSLANLYINDDKPVEEQLDNDSTDKDDFSSFISKLLNKDNSSKNTILKLGSDISNDTMIQMVLQTMSMRKDTISTHKIVAEEIERRVRVLIKAKERQLIEMQRIEEAKQKLQNDVENKAEKLDEINNKQEEFSKRASTVLLKLVSASPESVTTKKKRELLELYKTKMNLMSKRIEEAKEKWNIVQTDSTSTNKQLYGHRTFRLTLEQELVIKGNLSEMGSTILDLDKKVRDLRTTVNTIAS